MQKDSTRRLFILVALGLIGFAIGYSAMYFYKKSHEPAIQVQPAPTIAP